MSLSEILEKINSTPIQKGQKVAVAFSGGLDSSLAISFVPEVRSIKSASFDQRWCAHAAKIRGLPCEILASRQQNILNGVVS